MDDGYWPLSILVLLVLIGIEAVLYGFGAAIQNLNVGNLEKAAGEGDERAGRLLALIDAPGQLIGTIQVATGLIGIGAGAYVLGRLSRAFWRMVPALSRMQEGAGLVYGLFLAVVGVLLMACLISFGVVVPKRCAARNPEKWGFGMLPAVCLILFLLKPFTALVSFLSGLLLVPMGIDLHAEDDNVTEEDIMLMVNEGHEQGVLEAGEAEMITNIFELNDKEAGDIMTHRTNVTALDASMTLGEAVDYILTEANNSRFPVFEKDIDDIIGILHMRDALVFAEKEENRSVPLRELSGLLREAHFIPETRHIDTLFKEMQSQKIHMEIVVDEYGQTAGIVTMEDILEEIVGNILDEYDEDEVWITRREDGSFLLDGLAPLDEAAKALGMRLEEEDYENYDTLNGFLISHLGRIPGEDEKPELTCCGYRFRAVSVENKMLHTVEAIRCEEPAGQSDTDEAV